MPDKTARLILIALIACLAFGFQGLCGGAAENSRTAGPRDLTPDTPADTAQPPEKSPAEETKPEPPPPAAPESAGPAFTEEVLGRSVEGRTIKAMTFNESPEPPFLVFCSIHGDEVEAELLANVLESRWTDDPSLLGGRHVIFVPNINPDGVERRTRQNANKVDCNRNFPAAWEKSRKGSATYGGPSPLSEPESGILHELVEGRGPRAIISVHSCRNCGGMNNFDGPAEAWALEMEKHNGYKASGDWYQETPGSFGTWAGKHLNIPTVTLEMPRGTRSAEGLKNNARAIEAAILMDSGRSK